MTTEDIVSVNITEQFEKGAAGSAAASHTYAERIPLPGGGYRYIYSGSHGGTGSVSEPTGAPSPMRRGTGVDAHPQARPQEQPHRASESVKQTTYSRVIEHLSKKDEKQARAALQNVSYEHLQGLNAHVKDDTPLKKALRVEIDARRQQAATQAEGAATRREARKPKQKPKEKVQKSQADTLEPEPEPSDFEIFSEERYEEVQKSMSELHPDWNAAILGEAIRNRLKFMHDRQ